MSQQEFFDFGTFRPQNQVPASATPNHVDWETAPERGLVREWAVMSYQESRAKFVLISPVLLLLQMEICWQTMSDRRVVLMQCKRKIKKLRVIHAII